VNNYKLGNILDGTKARKHKPQFCWYGSKLAKMAHNISTDTCICTKLTSVSLRTMGGNSTTSEAIMASSAIFQLQAHLWQHYLY
jgi:hypothetical protein